MGSDASPVEIRVRLFATVRTAAGTESLTLRVDGRTVGDALERLLVQVPSLAECAPEGRLTERIVVLVNGRPVESLDGLETELGDGDTVALSPPVTGG